MLLIKHCHEMFCILTALTVDKSSEVSIWYGYFCFFHAISINV